MTKYYAVRVGRNVGIFNTWDECSKSINSYSGAIFKSFPTLEEANHFLDPSKIQQPPNQETPNNQLAASNLPALEQSTGISGIESKVIIAYTDGSCCLKKGKGGYAYLYFEDSSNIDLLDIEEISQNQNQSQEKINFKYEFVPIEHCTNNIAELFALQQLLIQLNNAPNINQKVVKIYSDSNYSVNSLNIWYKNWKLNEWKTAGGGAVENAKLIRSCLAHLESLRSKNIEVTLSHVFSHGKDKNERHRHYNDIVDKLASMGRLRSG